MNYTDPIVITPARRIAPVRTPTALLLTLCLSLGPVAMVGTAYAQGTSPAATVPGEVRSLRATAGALSVLLSWTAPASDGGASITDYQHRYTNATDILNPSYTDWQSTGSTDTSYTVTGLATGTKYFFQVRAVNSEGNGPLSTTSLSNHAATQRGVDAPGVPTNLVAAAGANAGEFTVTWDAPGADGSSAVIGYDVSFSQGRFAWEIRGTTIESPAVNAQGAWCHSSFCLEVIDATSVRIFGGNTNFTYVISVVARNGETAPSAVATASITLTTPPTATISLTAAVDNDGHVTLAWTVSSSFGSPEITGYEYRQSESAADYPVATSPWKTIASSDATTSSHTVTGLALDTEHFFQVRAVNTAGGGPESNEVSGLITTISRLDGRIGVSLADAKILYYARALGSLSNSGTLATVLGPLTTRDTTQVLADARALSLDLNGPGGTAAEDAAVLYYSFALEGALGNGGTRPGISAIKNAILGPLARGMDIDQMLRDAHEMRGQ